MYQVKVKHGNRIYSYTRDKYDRSIGRSVWETADEIMFAECLGLPAIDDAGAVIPNNWNAPRIEKLLWYKNCLTLRKDFDKIQKSELMEALDVMIYKEFRKLSYLASEKYDLEFQIAEQFKKVNHLCK